MTALIWDGCVNVRDLGGLPTADGGLTRFGAIVRADNLRALSPDGWHALVSHGVRRVVDLRLQSELDRDPPSTAPVEVVHVSLLGELDDEVDALHSARLDQTDDVTVFLVGLYGDFLDRYRRNVGAAVEAIAEAPEGCVAVHCMGGKDRTGLVSALVLRVAGVDVERVAADFALSEANLAPGHQTWVDQARDARDARHRRLLLPTPAMVMVEVLEATEGRYGSAAAYLQAAGVAESSLDRLRGRLLEEA